MTLNEISKAIVDCAFRVHTNLGPGLLEHVYEVTLAHELRKQYALQVERQKPIPIEYDGIRFEEGFRADLLVVGKVLIELKSVEQLKPLHKKQVLTYLKLMHLELGLLINFGGELLKGNIERLSRAAPNLPAGPSSGLKRRRPLEEC